MDIGRISKAIRFILKQLKIDKIFKRRIKKYKDIEKDEEAYKEKIRKDDSEINNKEDKENTLDNYSEEIREYYDKVKISQKLTRGIQDKEENVEKSIEYNKTMMQYFEWYYPSDGSLWNKLKNESENLKNLGITSVWLPPAYKAHGGARNVGYAAYDLYDLGEFDQKGTVRTKYGTKNEYIQAISEAHKNNIEVYGDVVFNHKAGADNTELVEARQVNWNNRNEFIGEKRQIKAHTVFDFPGRKGKYSDYKWSAKDFDGVDYDDITKVKGIFKFEGKEWEEDVDKENGNYDFLMFADLDMDSKSVVNELKNWGKWYLSETNVDGFRLDAIKHIKFDFFKDWLKSMRENSSKELFAVGEYWTWNIECLKYYLKQCDYSMSLFDTPLHFNFLNASSSSGFFDMRKILDNTLVRENSKYAVTFVDNHDTELGQSLESWVQPWFKPLAYIFILTRKEGYPCVFFGDYYGIPEKGYAGIKSDLDIIMNIRKNYAYGVQHDYIDHDSVIGWSREGDSEHENSGMAAVITNGLGGLKRMYVGHNHVGEVWYDVTNHIKENVVIDENGQGNFRVLDGSYSVWIKKIIN
ncbi:MAG: alpha-amylase [Clostridium sp.]|nr:alpha-amylase [Clostridium sp.]